MFESYFEADMQFQEMERIKKGLYTFETFVSSSKTNLINQWKYWKGNFVLVVKKVACNNDG